jgi:hypothetical protein
MFPSRRRKRVTSLAVSAELCEVRIALTQLVPVPDVVNTHFVVHTSLGSTLLGGFDDVAGERQGVIRTLDHLSGTLSAPQILPGASSVKASADGRLLITGVATTALTDSGDSTSNVEFVFYRRSNTGLYEETARYMFPTELNSGPVLAPVFHDEGAFLMVFARPRGRELFFLSSTQAAEPELVASTETASWGFHAESQGDDLFLESSESGARRLLPNGTIGNPIRRLSRPITHVNNQLLIYGNYQSLFSYNETTGQEEEIAAVSDQPMQSLISENGGPGGKTVLLTSASNALSVFVTDGTAAGTTEFKSLASVNYDDAFPSAVLLSDTSTVIVSSYTRELWSLNISNGNWTRLLDTNEFGGDRISDLVVRGSQVWFRAQESDGDIGIYRTNGISTIKEFDFVERIEPLSVVGNETSSWVVEVPSVFPVVPHSSTSLYKVDSAAPDLPPGPAHVSAAEVADGSGRMMEIEWSPVAGALRYHVAVVPWRESGAHDFSTNNVTYSLETIETHLNLRLSPQAGYGWHTVRVRAIDASGKATDWSSTPLSLRAELIPPDQSQLLIHNNELRFGYRYPQSADDWFRPTILVDRANDQSLIYNETSSVRFEPQTAGTPFEGSQGYYYHRLPDLPDGDYIVTFLRQYTDPNPQPVDLTLPAGQVVTWLTLRNGQIVQTPPVLNVMVDPETVQFSWAEPLAPDRQEYLLWVSDLSRGTPRIINEFLRGDSTEHSLPNGHYRAFIGRKDSITGQTIWSAPVEFTVSTEVPELINPLARSAVRRPVFRWAGSERSRYEVWLGDLGKGTRVALNRVSGSTQWSPSIDLPVGRYALWVRELVTDTVASNWSLRHVFIQDEPAVVVTGDLDPGLNQTPQMTWESRADASTYELWISRTGVPGAVYFVNNLRGTSHRLARPIGNGTFTVWVRATLKDGRTTAWGTGHALVIDAGVQVQSSGSKLTWNSVSTANRYELWVNFEGGDAAQQAKILHLASLRSTSYDLPSALPQGHYRAWVRALRVVGKRTSISSWSAPVEFTIT